MSANYIFTEPHPTVAKNSYIHSGRGGAGNTFRVVVATTSPSGIPTLAATSPRSSKGRFFSGRGGAGNAHTAATERPVLSFDEECARAEVRNQATTVGLVGRGGAGNVYTCASPGTSAFNDHHGARRDSASTHSDTGSVPSVRSFWRRLSAGSSAQHK